MLDAPPQSCHSRNHGVGSGSNHIDCLRNGEAWYCVRTLSGREGEVAKEIEGLGFPAFFPRIVARFQRYGRPQQVLRPLFPGYLFAAFSLSDDWGAIHRLNGRNRIILRSSGLPSPLVAGAVEGMLAITDDKPDTAIPDGSSLRVRSGPLVDWTGVCQWTAAHRVGVLMQMFGGERVVTMARADVEVA